MKHFILFLLVVFHTTTSCSKEKISNDCKGEPQLIYCTKEYIPVCGCDGVTYGNACEAQAAGVQRWDTGKCQ